MKSLGDFLAQNHKGMINSTRRWAVFVEGAGNEEQPTETHPEISKCTVLRRNRLPVFHLSPCQRLNASFESCLQKTLRQWVHQREVKRHLQIFIIKSYPKATKPISLSKILHHPHKPLPHSLDIPNIYTTSRRAGEWWGKQSRVGTALGKLWKMRQKSQGRVQGKGSALGSSAGAPHVPQQSQCDSRALNPECSAEPSRGRERWLGEGWSPRATYCPARLLSALSNWLSQRIGGNFTN